MRIRLSEVFALCVEVSRVQPDGIALAVTETSMPTKLRGGKTNTIYADIEATANS